MNNKQKIVIGVLLTLIGCVATPLAFHYFGGTKTPNVDLDKLQEQFNVQLETQLSNQKKSFEEEYNNKLIEFENKIAEEKKKEEAKELENRRITEKLKELLLSYYDSNVARETIVHSIDGNEQITTLSFNEEKKNLMIEDNSDNISNTYSILHKNSKVKDDDILVEKNDIEFSIFTDDKSKFDINRSKLALAYFNMLIGRDLTSKEKTALNIQANMNLSDLSSIDDVNIYIYNGDSLKIGDFIFNCKKGKDNVTGLKYFKYKITSYTESNVKTEE